MVPQLKTKNKPQKIGKPEQWKTKMSHYSKKSERLRKCQNKKTFFFFKKGLIILDVHPPFVCCFMSLWSVAHKCWCTLYYRGLFVYEGGGKYQKPSGQWARLIWPMWWHKKWQIFEKVANICAGQGKKVITTDRLDEKWGPPSGMMFIAYSL